MKDLFGNPVDIGATSKNKINPCIAVYGKGPDGTRCKTCIHIYAKRYANTYYKCELRKNTNGPGTDHKVNFPTCGKYQERKDKQ